MKTPDDDGCGSHPPLSPQGEAPAEITRPFAEGCMEAFRTAYPVTRARLELPVITRSSKWGLLLRGDFKLKDDPNSALINRFVCWQKQDGGVGTLFATGQQIIPLNAED